MINFSRILVPVDLSEFSQRAVDHAAAIAHWYDASMTVLFVFANMPVMDVPPLVLPDVERERIVEALREVTRQVPSGVSVDLQVREAYEVHREILAEAERIHADLVVLGSHGRSGVGRLLLGSVTEKVMREARGPTLVVPRRAPDTSPNEPVRFRRIVCPVDFSEGSLEALKYATSLAEEADAELTAVHVIEIPPELVTRHGADPVDVDRIRAEAEAERLRELRALIPAAARTFCTVHTAVREGAAYREILRVAGETDADLIVMGVQGRGAVDLMVFGSNTARVTRSATCPVLIVPTKP
jgi:nucleotide-binding universal stress UspA family protein